MATRLKVILTTGYIEVVFGIKAKIVVSWQLLVKKNSK